MQPSDEIDGESGAMEDDLAAIWDAARVAVGAPSPALVLLAGLPASGKSWLAEHLAGPLEAALSQSDVRRRELFAVPTGYRHRGPYDAGMYSAEAKQKVYDSLLDDARRSLEAGRRVVIDGSFVQAKWRAPFERLARELGAPFVFVEVTAPEEVVRARITERVKDTNQPSDADFEVYLKLKQQREPLDECGEHERLVVESPVDLIEVVEHLVAKLRAQVAGA